MEETGRVKTDLGECNFKVTRPDSKCTKILVSNAVQISFRLVFGPQKTLVVFKSTN